MSWFGKSVGVEAADKLRDTHHAVTVRPGASGSHKVDHRVVVDDDVKRSVNSLVNKIKKLHGGHALKALGGLAAAAGAVHLGSSVGKNIGDKLTKRKKPQVHVHVSPQGQMMKAADVSKEDLKKVLKKHEERETPEQEADESTEEQKIEREAGVEKKAFWEGFEKAALQQTRGQEDLATIATSRLPFGTTLHTMAKDKKGGDRGKEWLARMGGSMLGGATGVTLGYTGKANVRPFVGRKYNNGRAIVGAIVGAGLGELIANRMVHSGKYDESGKLKKEYGGRHDDESKNETNPVMGY